MPSKIGYSVVGVTGEAEGFSAKNLEHQRPTVPGWQTQKFCVYPQEIIIRLNEGSSVKKLQLLSHQYMIPSKIEFFVGTSESPDTFKRLGYIYLSNNEKTGFKSRELKSVHVEAEGSYIRVVVHKNHLNKFNIYNQVGIMAFNVIGDRLNMRRPLQQLDDGKENHLFEKPDYISPMDDLAFDMYQDPEVASIIRRLDIKKKNAVTEENFDIAKRMKQAIADLQKVGEKLARYELDKRRAIEYEDYDLAKSKKSQMDEYRLKVYQQLQKHNLLQDAGVSTTKQEGFSPLKGAPEQSQPYYESQPIETQPQSPVFNQQQSQQSQLSPPQQSIQTSPSPYAQHVDQQESQQVVHQQVVEQRQASPTNYDEKVLPALNKDKSPDPFLDEIPSPRSDGGEFGGGEDGPVAPSNEPEAMSEKSIREASSVIDVFGLPLVSGAYSKTWSFREDCLLAVYKLLSSATTESSKDELKEKLRAAVFLVKRSIKDKVHAVFNAALKVLELILVEFIPKHKLGKVETSHVITKTLPNLIQKTGETAARSRNSAIDFIVFMSESAIAQQHHLVVNQLTPGFKRETANRLALSRVELVARVLSKSGVRPPDLTVPIIMNFCAPALKHPSGEVRVAATKIIFNLYKLAGPQVKSFLPPDDNQTRKNPLYRNMFDEFDRMDGRPTQAELHQKALQDERKKKHEIEDLQAQVNQLRALNQANDDSQKPDQKSKKQKKHTEPKQVAQANESVNKSVNPDDSAFLEKLCIFCGEQDDDFTEEGLDLHYWKHCPMLKRCEHCKQVAEVAGYSEHLLTECDSKDNFGKCPRCTEAFPKSDLQKHIGDKKCTVLDKDHEHCPLCHHNIALGEESWKAHLMGAKRDCCEKNPRRLPSINRLRAKQEGDKAKAKKSGIKPPKK